MTTKIINIVKKKYNFLIYKLIKKNKNNYFLHILYFLFKY